MILCRLADADAIVPLHPAFSAALGFLRETDLAALGEGKHAIDGDRLFVIIAREAGRGLAGARLESHQQFIDLQFTIDGVERIGWKATADCAVATPYDRERDIAFYSDVPETWLEAPAGTLAIFFPSDAHAPLATSDRPRKAIVKIAVDWGGGREVEPQPMA